MCWVVEDGTQSIKKQRANDHYSLPPMELDTDQNIKLIGIRHAHGNNIVINVIIIFNECGVPGIQRYSIEHGFSTSRTKTLKYLHHIWTITGITAFSHTN